MVPKLIVDVDCGTDDALALMLALSNSNKCEVLAITCVCGNTSLENVYMNVLRVLDVCHNKQISVFKGCEKPLVCFGSPEKSIYHGEDGFGNVSSEFPVEEFPELETDHASIAILKLVQSHHKEITFVALAPLTNLAVCQRLDPSFTSSLKEIIIMGGNIEGRGNTFPAAEFNFHTDPEAAHMILSESECPVTIIPYETCLKYPMLWNWYDRWVAIDTEKATFIRKVTARGSDRQRCRFPGFVCCDLLTMAVVIERTSITTVMSYPVYVELSGNYTRGMMVVDQRYQAEKPKTQVAIVTEVNAEDIQEMYIEMLH